MKTQNSAIQKNSKSKKKRQVVKGLVRDAAKTKGLLLDAFSEILAEKDFRGITVYNIEKKSKRDKMLIYRYFGGLDQLKNAYIKNRNFEEVDIESNHIADRLISEFDEQCENKELQGTILWSLNERRQKTREAINRRFQNVVDNGTDDHRVAKAVVMAGLTYIALYSQKENPVICGIDVSTKEGKDIIKDAVKMIFKSVENLTQ